MKFIYCGYGSEGSFSIHSPFLFRGSRLQRGIPRVLDLQTARSAAACESAATEDQVKSRQDRTNPTVRVFTLILVFLSLSSNRLLFGQDKSLLVQWSPDCTWTTQRDLVLSLLLTEFHPPGRLLGHVPLRKWTVHGLYRYRYEARRILGSGSGSGTPVLPLALLLLLLVAFKTYDGPRKEK